MQYQVKYWPALSKQVGGWSADSANISYCNNDSNSRHGRDTNQPIYLDWITFLFALSLKKILDNLLYYIVNLKKSKKTKEKFYHHKKVLLFKLFPHITRTNLKQSKIIFSKRENAISWISNVLKHFLSKLQHFYNKV